MKSNSFKLNGMEEMSIQEARSTEGGSLTVVLVCLTTFLLTSCFCPVPPPLEGYEGPIETKEE